MLTTLRRLLLIPMILCAGAGDAALAQVAEEWEITEQGSYGFYQTRKHNKNVVVAADAAHYAFLSSHTADELYLSDDTASTLRLARSDAHPILHYDMAYPTVDRIYVLADSVFYNQSRWDPVAGMIFRTEDRGATWDTIRFPAGVALARLAMADALHGIATQHYRDSSTYFRTTDGWRTWQRLDLPADVGPIYNLAAPEPDVYIINGTIRTTDGGVTWQRATVAPVYGVQHRMRFLDRNRGWSAGGTSNGNGDQRRDVIHRTTDGGMTWTLVLDEERGLPFGLGDIVFSDALHGYASGHAAKLLATNDGGLTWTTLSLPDELTATFNLAYLASPRPGVAVGVGNGVVVRRRTSVVADVSVNAAQSLRAYPVPARSLLTVEGLAPGARVTLTSITGLEAARALSSAVNQTVVRIDLAGLARGVYLLRALSERGSETRLVVVE